jgi:hypothetical protein
MLVAMFIAAFAAAGTLTVTSPTEGAYLGANNNLKFQITGATLEVTINVNITGPGGTTNIQKRFTPDSDGKINDQIAINFSQSSPEGAYSITVTATEPGNTYTPVTVNVNVDVTKPKFFDFNPVADSFVKGPNVPIIVQVVDANFKEYRVQVNNQDIPNNTGTSLDSNNSFNVNWNVDGILQDGAQTITITVKDLADNEETKTMTVTIDRIAPTTTIQYPRADTRVRPHSTIPVTVDVSDQSANSVSVTGIDVVIRDMNNNLIMRVPRTSFSNGRWMGRILSTTTLPKKFKLVATTTDRAGNVGVPQTTVVTVG